MRTFWNNLGFFWKIYTGATVLMILVVMLAEFAEDFIPSLIYDRAGGSIHLSQQLEEYAATPEELRGAMRSRLRSEGTWVLDVLPENVRETGKTAVTPSVLDILPESDDWTTEWIVVEKVLPGGRLVALGRPEPWYYDALEWVIWVLVIAVFAGVSCYWLTKFLTSRLQRITQAATLLAAGDLNVRVPVEQDSGDELSELARSFNSMTKSIGDVLENERRLLYDISHELRSPLARMQLALDLLGHAESANKEECLALLADDTQRMSEMVSGIIEQGKTSTVMHEPALERLDIRELLSDVVELMNFECRYGEKDTTCRLFGLPHSSVFLRANRGLLEQALLNVLSNAVRYSPDGANVEIRAELAATDDSGKHLIVEIRDFGPGVPEKSLENLFKPFFRVESARDRDSGGVGLGLALARSYIARHNGGISAANAKPGLIVRIMLPV